MPTPPPDVTLSTARPAVLDVDWLVVPVWEGETAEAIAPYDSASGGEVGRALASGEFKGKTFEVFMAPVVARDWRPRRVVFVGAGKRSDLGTDRLRRVATAAGLAARERKPAAVAFVCRSCEPEPAPFAQAVTEALLFSTFDTGRYKTSDHEPWCPRELIVDVEGHEGAERLAAAVHRGRVLGECTNWTRDLANEPGNRLRPHAFADRAADLASHVGLSVEILDERRIGELGMGLLLGVGRGSEEPPRLLVMRHETPSAAQTATLGLVGKGVTFDTGGISIKPSQGMERMKDDMAGGAAVVGAMCAISRLAADVRVVGVVPIAENMPSGHAIRPGDVLQSASGKSVEVLDTDAEGRLILGDALWYARRLGATHLVDVATLTGACMVALGNTTSGLFGRPQQWVETVLRAADGAGDRVWQMPLFEDYREQLRSDIADIKNVGGRPAGAITAAMFLSEFAGDGPWAHLDIAGTAWNEEGKAYLPKGPTGAAVRTLAALAFTPLPANTE